MNALMKLLTEPFRKGDQLQPLGWRMAMRWSHLPQWVKRIPCVFGHWWGHWEATKYVSRGWDRNCRVCGKGQSRP